MVDTSVLGIAQKAPYCHYTQENHTSSECPGSVVCDCKVSQGYGYSRGQNISFYTVMSSLKKWSNSNEMATMGTNFTHKCNWAQ